VLSRIRIIVGDGSHARSRDNAGFEDEYGQHDLRESEDQLPLRDGQVTENIVIHFQKHEENTIDPQ